MEQYPFYVEVTWEYLEDNKYKQKQESVILMAKTFADAVGKIEEDYGDKLCSIEKVECISDCSTLTLPIAEGRKLVKLFTQYDRGEFPVENVKQVKEVRWNPLEDTNPPIVPKGTMIIVDYNAY